MKKYVCLFLSVFSFSYGQVFSGKQEYTNPQISPVLNPFSQSQFIPDIALIFDFSYVARNVGDETYKKLSIPSFVHQLYDDHGGHGHKPMNFERGFNLNYSELSLYSTVDPYFDLFATFHLSENNFEIEELFFNTLSLPYSFQIKAGKFRSSIGKINPQHQHIWDFADIPLVYKVFFGYSLNEKGIQISWLAPTDFYLLLGTEIFQGKNEQSFGYGAIEVFAIPQANKPNVYTGFVKTSYDIGNLTVLGGGSFINGKTRFDHTQDEESPHAFAGNTKIYGLDLTGKYFLDSYRYLSVQGEYFYRDMKGRLYENLSSPTAEDLEKKQSGYYVQFIHRFGQRWRYGIRYDCLNKNEINSIPKSSDLNRYSFMVEFNTSEFARIRFQYNYDRSKFLEGKRKNLNEFILEFNMAIGAHGAHPF